MPHARSEPELHSRRVSLYIGASPEAAWKNVVRHWLERIASCTLQDKNPAAVVTASLSQAYFFRSRLLAESKSLLSNLLLFGFDAAHWPLWPLLHAATLSADEATVVLSDPRDEARDLDETWIGTWEETFGAAEVIPATNRVSTGSSVESLPVPVSNVHFVIGRDTTQQA